LQKPGHHVRWPAALLKKLESINQLSGLPKAIN
jgi:hypothetical protein